MFYFPKYSTFFHLQKKPSKFPGIWIKMHMSKWEETCSISEVYALPQIRSEYEAPTAIPSGSFLIVNPCLKMSKNGKRAFSWQQIKASKGFTIPFISWNWGSYCRFLFSVYLWKGVFCVWLGCCRLYTSIKSLIGAKKSRYGKLFSRWVNYVCTSYVKINILVPPVR